jgi:hypothetical protein
LAWHAAVVSRTGYPLVNISEVSPHWSAHQRMFAWLKNHSQPGEVATSGLDSMVALYTGCQAFRPFEYQPGQLFYGQPAARSMDEELMAILELRRPQYLVQLPMPEFAEERPFAKAVAELRSSHPEWLSVAYQDPEPGFVIYKVHPPQPQAAVVQSQ